MIKKVIIIIFLFFLFCSLSYAEGNVFPFPKGNVYVTNGYGGSETHQGTFYYSLDFRSYNNTDRCDSYGVPILAAKSGVIIKAINPIKEKLDDGYGVHVYVKNNDNSVLRYAHMIDGSLAVKSGDSVRQGQILGLLGATGYTIGAKCQAFDGVNNGAHLHFESRDQNNSKLNPEPIIGQENYTNMSIAGNPYISTTLMYDPTNHWAKYKGRVPYNLTYTSSVIHSISPLIVQADTEQIFMIKGENLFDDLSVTLSGCRNLKWIKKESNEQQFSCNITSIKGGKTGFIRFSSGRKPDFHFEINIVSEKEDIEPKITKAEAINPIADKVTEFIIEGENLPADLEFDLKLCKDISYQKITLTYRRFSCRLPHTIYDKNQKRVNGLYTFNTNLTSKSVNYSHSFLFEVDYEVKVENVEPMIAIANEKAIFTFTGKNINLSKAIWIEKCDNLREIDRSDQMMKVECTPQNPYRLWYMLVSDVFKKDFYKVILKDEPGGTTLFESGILIIPNDTEETEEGIEVMDEGGVLDNEYDINFKESDNHTKYQCLFGMQEFSDNKNIIKKDGDTIIVYRHSIVGEITKADKGSIAFFVQKSNNDFFNDMDIDPLAYKVDLYKALVEKYNLKKVGISMGENNSIYYYISPEEMKSMLKKDYCFISLLQQDQFTPSERVICFESYFNSVK